MADNAGIIIVPLDDPSLWPTEFLSFLDEHHDLFWDWTVGPHRFDAKTYDAAIYRLADLLQPYALVGWHCTRLVDAEVCTIKATGMQPPNEEILSARIDAVLQAGLVSAEVAAVLKSKNQAAEANRRGCIWWCFHPPRSAGESGIGALLGTWGGEALYNWHRDDAIMGPILRSIGTPSLVEAAVPISLLNRGISPTFTFIAQYLRHKGHPVEDRLEFAGNIKDPLPAANIRRVILHPEPAFLELTGCDTWRNRLPIPSYPYTHHR